MNTWVHEYMSTKVSSIKSYFPQVALYIEWINQKMASPTVCHGGEYARNQIHSLDSVSCIHLTNYNTFFLSDTWDSPQYLKYFINLTSNIVIKFNLLIGIQNVKEFFSRGESQVLPQILMLDYRSPEQQEVWTTDLRYRLVKIQIIQTTVPWMAPGKLTDYITFILFTYYRTSEQQKEKTSDTLLGSPRLVNISLKPP